MYRLFVFLFSLNLALGHFNHDFNFHHGGDDDCEFDDSGPDSDESQHGPHNWSGPHDWSGPDHGPGHHHGPGHQHGPGWGHPWHGQASDFDKLARYVISADKQVYNSCKQSSYSRVRVLPGEDTYALKYNLPEFAESGIKLQIKHRVISATAEAQGVPTFKDLRIIPEFVKVADASWSFHNGTLTVLMPYKNPLKTEVALDCTSNINESVIDVAKMTNSEDDLRILN